MEKIAILDFGSQYSPLIVKKLRKLKVFSELFPPSVSIDFLRSYSPKGIILSGGPESVTSSNHALEVNALKKIAPVLGICYGLQLISHQDGGQVFKNKNAEYGLTPVTWSQPIEGIPATHSVWMSHSDFLFELPKGFEVLASSLNSPVVLQKENILALQFHPEVSHTEHGDEIFKYFLKDMCFCSYSWKNQSFLQEFKMYLKKNFDTLYKDSSSDRVLCALSGGVDSSILGVFLTQEFGQSRVQCVFVDTGLMRANETQQIIKSYESIGLNVEIINAQDDFFRNLKGVIDPEKKRKIIGKTFIDVFERKASDLKNIKYLAQGTLYSDVIESSSSENLSHVIKTHHNVGGLPKDLKWDLIEPFKKMFKDEIRQLGKDLNMTEDILGRHPFPGPGLAIRILGEVTPERVSLLQKCDVIFIHELKKLKLYDKIWQAFCVLLPIKTVGVQGDTRTYKYTLALRAVTSVDGMTAQVFEFDMKTLQRISTLISNQVSEINRVVYDISNKPPATIEWE